MYKRQLLLPLTSPGNIFVNDQVYPLRRGTLYLIGENTLHRTIATGFHARYVLHIGLKALTALSTPQTDFTQIGNAAFLDVYKRQWHGRSRCRPCG